MKTFKIFVIFHNEINLTYFDPSILGNIVFVNVNPANPHTYPGVNVLNLYDLPGFIPLGKWYTESEVIYNIYKDRSILDGSDYVGFIHYDMDLTPFTGELLKADLNKYDLINFQPNRFKDDYNQNILMDPDKPDTLSGEGKNCYLTIFNDLNAFYGADYDPGAFMEEKINLCSAFLIKKELFHDMMAFAAGIMESGKLNRFDREHTYRIQGGLMERYFGAWCMLRVDDPLNYTLKHDFVQTKIQNSFIRRLLRKLGIHK